MCRDIDVSVNRYPPVMREKVTRCIISESTQSLSCIQEYIPFNRKFMLSWSNLQYEK